jgi:hypothetical protein
VAQNITLLAGCCFSLPSDVAYVNHHQALFQTKVINTRTCVNTIIRMEYRELSWRGKYNSPREMWRASILGLYSMAAAFLSASDVRS